jgi:hypothetical protein
MLHLVKSKSKVPQHTQTVCIQTQLYNNQACTLSNDIPNVDYTFLHGLWNYGMSVLNNKMYLNKNILKIYD